MTAAVATRPGAARETLRLGRGNTPPAVDAALDTLLFAALPPARRVLEPDAQRHFSPASACKRLMDAGWYKRRCFCSSCRAHTNNNCA